MTPPIDQDTPLPDWWTRVPEEIEARLTQTIEEKITAPAIAQQLLATLSLAAQLHDSQCRAGGEKYICHPFRVCLSLIRELAQTQPELLLAALLHDILEDTPYPLAKLQQSHGQTVAALVDHVTRKADEQRPNGQGDQLGDRYFQRILSQSQTVILLKCADKLDNIRDARYHPKPEKVQIYLQECQEIYLPIIDSLLDQPLAATLRHHFLQAMDHLSPLNH